RAAGGDHAGFLLLARGAGGLVLDPARGSFRAPLAIRRPRELHRRLRGSLLHQLADDDGDLQPLRRGPGDRPGPPPRGDGRSRRAGGHGLQDDSAFALRRGARDRRRAVAVPLRARDRRRRARSPASRHRLELRAARRAGDASRHHRLRLEADQLQFPLLSRRPAIDPEIAHRGGRDRRRRRGQAVLGRGLPASFADHVLPSRRQRRLCLLRHVRHHPCGDAGRTRQGDRDPRLQGLVRRRDGARSRRVLGAVRGAHGNRDRAHGDPVPLRRAKGALLMRRARAIDWLPHAVLLVGIAIIAFPVYVTVVASTLTTPEIVYGPMSLLPGPHGLDNYAQALSEGNARTSGVGVDRMLLNTLVVALAIAVGKIAISIISAYAVVFFNFPGRMAFFWLIFLTLMLPVEVRIVPTYAVVAGLGL